MQWLTALTHTQLRFGKFSGIIFGLVVYVLLTAAVLLWYQDDVEQMNWADREVFNHKIISKYQLNDTVLQQQVLARLGAPDITFAQQQGKVLYQVLYYRTHRSKADGITTADECTALLFKNRRLIAIGDAATSQYQAATTSAKQ